MAVAEATYAAALQHRRKKAGQRRDAYVVHRDFDFLSAASFLTNHQGPENSGNQMNSRAHIDGATDIDGVNRDL